jgi:gliding motility-associated lipoprotein GldD
MQRIYKIIIFLLITFTFIACKEEYLPKPKAFLRLNYDITNFKSINSGCPYIFEVSNNTKVEFNDKCWVNIKYPALKATLNITYRPVENNLNELLRESEKLTYNHAIKADGISTLPYENGIKKTFGSISEVTGNAASPIQFYLTDSTKHFITGALYFEVQPNYDSILPAVKYLEKDIKHLMETLEWNTIE